MEPRSRMAALALVAGLLVMPRAGASPQQPSSPSEAQSGATKSAPAAEATDRAAKSDPSSPTQNVKLKVLIAGLGRGGCDVEVKPGNRSCRFKPQAQHVGAPGELSFQFKDVEVRGADRNCTFAITVREAGQPSKTIYRGYRMPANGAQPGGTAAAQTFTCYMNSPSKLADLDRTDRVRQ